MTKNIRRFFKRLKQELTTPSISIKNVTNSNVSIKIDGKEQVK